MKLKIKVKVLTEGCVPSVNSKGDLIDLKAAKDIQYTGAFANILSKNREKRDVEIKYELIPLGVAIKLPKGFKAVISPRSSSFKNFGFIQSNSIGQIDNSYSGNNDEWKLPVLFINDGIIHKYDRICQFDIQLSQKATFWQKLKWLFSSGIEIVQVNNLDNINRSGFGSTGI